MTRVSCFNRPTFFRSCLSLLSSFLSLDDVAGFQVVESDSARVRVARVRRRRVGRVFVL